MRVNRIMARHNMSEAEALKAINTSDKERGNHYFRYTDQKWGKAQNYDVCINAGLMGIEKTAEMLADPLFIYTVCKPNASNCFYLTHK